MTPRDRETPGCPSPETGRRPDAPAPRPEKPGPSQTRFSSADERNREQDAWDDYLDALGELRKTRSLRDAYVAAALFGRWLAMRRRRT